MKYTNNYYPLSKSNMTRLILNNLPPSRFKSEASVKKLTRNLKDVITIVKVIEDNKATGEYLPVTLSMSYGAKLRDMTKDTEFGETILKFTAHFPSGTKKHAVFSWHSIKRIFERYDDFLHEHNNDVIIQKLFNIWQQINLLHAEEGAIEIDDIKLAWSTAAIGDKETACAIRTFLPQNYNVDHKYTSILI